MRPARDIEFDGELDEIQISNVVRSVAWQDATYYNQATSSDFYAAGSQESKSARIFSDTNVSILGDLVQEAGANAIYPSGTLSIGGSLDNNAEFDANSGTVRFNSLDSGETVAVGASDFATLTFDSATGGFTITDHATATVAINLISVGDWTLNSGLVLDSAGTFSNTAINASTTWTGSTLRLSGGTDFAINSKTDDGDDYATLSVTGDGDISAWNSSSGVYDLQSTASFYSQDHDGNDGDLYIFGNYVRNSGTEHWSYATDFDGTDLSGGNERLVNVRVVSGGTVIASSSTLSIQGSATASTTVDSQSGTFTLRAQNATVDAEYFTMTGTDADGFNLTSSTTITSFDNSLFSIGAGTSAVTVDATTVDTNPASQFFKTDFITVGGSANVTLSGSPTSYWWFRDGVGDRYGEAYDNADGDPGSIRWDDSSYDIVVSGTVYADDGSSTLGGPTCDGVTSNVRIVVDGGVYTSSTACSGVNGAYSFPNVTYVGDPTIVVYLDTGGGVQGSVITKTPTGDITDLDVYANRVMTRHEDASPLSIADMAGYDESDDSDLRFVAATGTPDTLIVRPDTELIVASSTTFVPGGNITLQSGGSGSAYDGSLHLDNNATLTFAGTQSHQIGGSLFVDTDATLTTASTLVTFTATTSGKTITSEDAAELNFYELSFTGVGGAWNVNTDISLTDDLTVATGTLTGTGDVTLTSGSFTGSGLVSFGAGETTIASSTTLGGVQGWTFYDLTLGNGVIVGTTTRTDTATTTIGGQLTISTGHFLDAGSSLWNLTGSGNVFIENGTFLEDTSRVTYGGTTDANVLSTNYYDLVVAGSGGTPTFTAGATGVNILNNLTVSGIVATVFTLNTNDPVYTVNGDVEIGTNGTLIASNSTSLTTSGSWDNNGTFTSSNGEVIFDSSDGYTISAGGSWFGDLTLSGSGVGVFDESATSTGVTTFATTSNVTVNPSTVLAVGGQFTNSAGGGSTTWTDSILYLYGGGDYLVNAKTVSDIYGTLQVGANTDVRIWNSSASTTIVDSTGSLYSMDHADTSGDLYIYGSYQEDTRTDYWSYATDFDGTNLSGGSERKVDVYIASSSLVEWSAGGISVIGSSTATTTIQNQGLGTFRISATGTTAFNWNRVTLRDVSGDGVEFGGSPTVTGFTNLDLLAEINNASLVTISGSVITANPAKNFSNNIFNSDVGVTGAANVELIGSTLSAWRFTAHSGDLDGEANDIDSGNPGEIIWDDSDAIITISGNIYEADTSTVSSACDDSTHNIVLAVAGSLAQQASSTCASADGSYSITGVSFSANDTLTLYIDGNAARGATVTVDPISSISDMDIYEEHVIVRHENTDPVSIDDLSVWDSSDDADIPFTAVDAGTDTLALPANKKLVVWTGKTFEPNGDVTISGGGAGADYDGTLELYSNADYVALGNDLLSIGGSHHHMKCSHHRC